MEQQDIRNLRVSDVMHGEWPTVERADTVEAIIKVFASDGVSGCPVLENGKLVGIVTEGDLIFRDAEIDMPGFLDILGGMIPLGNWDEYQRETLKSAAVTAEQVMTENPHTVSPDTSLTEAATIMADKRLKILPVTDENDSYQGVLTRMDILTLHILNPRM